ncbi:MAG: VOC family protein [Myxococcota bacterium]
MSTHFPHGTFNWTDLVAKDIGEIRPFYEQLFGWTYEEQSADHQGAPPYGVFFKDGKQAAGIGQMSDAMKDGGTPSTWNTYVAVDDIKATETRVKQLGGSLMFDTIQVGDNGRTNWVRDPEGAVFALWEAGRHEGAGIFNEPGSFSWNERATRNMDQVKGFYGELFNWRFKDDGNSPNPMAMIHRADGREQGHVLLMNEQWGELPPHWSVYFTVARCTEAMDQAKALGGTSPFGPIDIDVGRFALLTDPQGAHFYVFEAKS